MHGYRLKFNGLKYIKTFFSYETKCWNLRHLQQFVIMVWVKQISYNLKLIFQNINNVLFNKLLSLKCNCWMKERETQMHLNINHSF
jgi:hypothetical protein